MSEDLKEVRGEPWGPGRRAFQVEGTATARGWRLFEDWERVCAKSQ